MAYVLLFAGVAVAMALAAVVGRLVGDTAGVAVAAVLTTTNGVLVRLGLKVATAVLAGADAATVTLSAAGWVDTRPVR